MPFEMEMEQTQQSEQVACMEGLSGRVDAQVDGDWFPRCFF